MIKHTMTWHLLLVVDLNQWNRMRRREGGRGLYRRGAASVLCITTKSDGARSTMTSWKRVRARVEELARHDPPIEQQFSLPDQWSRHLFLALCRRHGLRPFRYHRQRRNTVMIRASRGFVDKVLLPEFTELERALQVYLHEVTLRVIREAIYGDTSDAQEVPDALPSN
jgi:hypothetical protein